MIVFSYQLTFEFIDLDCTVFPNLRMVAKNTKKNFEIINKIFFYDKQDHFINEIEKQNFFFPFKAKKKASKVTPSADHIFYERNGT